jgi:hypothetical protein
MFNLDITDLTGFITALVDQILCKAVSLFNYGCWKVSNNPPR